MSKGKWIFWGSVVVAGGAALWGITHPLQALVGGAAVTGGAYLTYKARAKLAERKKDKLVQGVLDASDEDVAGEKGGHRGGH